jgi:hypothetical protein
MPISLRDNCVVRKIMDIKIWNVIQFICIDLNFEEIAEQWGSEVDRVHCNNFKDNVITHSWGMVVVCGSKLR